MVKVTLFTGVFLCCFLNTAFSATMEQENDIATACKPYIEQYTGNEDPDKLSASAQKALKTCSDHGSCQTAVLSGIRDCAIRLNELQPNQTPAVIVPQTPTPAPAPPNPFGLPAPPTLPGSSDTTQTQPATSPATTEPSVTVQTPTTNAPTNAPPSNSTSPSTSPDDKKSTTTINWF